MAAERCVVKFLYNLIVSQGITKTLEVGLGEGLTAMAMIAAKDCEMHTVIDHAKTDVLGVRNLTKIGLIDYLRFIKKWSYLALPILVDSKDEYELSFIDGGGKFDDMLIDFFYIDLMTVIGGFIIIPDLYVHNFFPENLSRQNT